MRQRKDYWKKRRARIQKTPAYKKSRLVAKKLKKQKRQMQGKKEGLSYVSDIAFLQTSYSVDQPEITFKSVNLEDAQIVYVDLETTGLKGFTVSLETITYNKIFVMLYVVSQTRYEY